MSEVKMGLKQVILQRVKTINEDIIGDATSDFVNTQQQHHHQQQQVTDFSINRILSSNDSKNKSPTMVTNLGEQFPGLDRILDLSKNGLSLIPYTNTYDAFPSDFIAAAAAAAQIRGAKFYSNFFPQIFTKQHLQHPFYQQPVILPMTSQQVSTSTHLYRHLPYDTLISGVENGAKSVSRTTTAGSCDSEIIRPKVCSHNCSDCDLYFNRYQRKYTGYNSSWFNGNLGHIRSTNIDDTELSISNLNLKSEKSSMKDFRLITGPSSLTATTTTTLTTVSTEEMSYKCRICDKVFGCPQTLQVMNIVRLNEFYKALAWQLRSVPVAFNTLLYFK